MRGQGVQLLNGDEVDTEDCKILLFMGVLFARCPRCMRESVSDMHVLALCVGNGEVVPLQANWHGEACSGLSPCKQVPETVCDLNDL